MVAATQVAGGACAVIAREGRIASCLGIMMGPAIHYTPRALNWADSAALPYTFLTPDSAIWEEANNTGRLERFPNPAEPRMGEGLLRWVNLGPLLRATTVFLG